MILIEKTSTVPEFTGHSYLQFFGLGKDIYRETDIEVVFKPAEKNGLILYNGYSSSGGDFISLALLNGYLEFRFDLGTGPAVIRFFFLFFSYILSFYNNFYSISFFLNDF